ncbi:MAG TPA: hypothetical protein VNK92_07440 [Vicinamibacterales bacterium]|nr:hypothetical protein [Vicinamibacterales bacterium]
MRRIIVLWSLALLAAVPAAGQQASKESEVRRAVPYSALKRLLSDLTPAEYDRLVRELAREARRPVLPLGTYLGRLSVNPYLPDSTANSYGRFGSPYAPNSIANPYGRYGNPYSPYSATNPYATRAPRLFGQDGKYLGRLSANPYDPESVSNPYGRYGSPYSPDSINNPYGRYGSPYSPYSPFNPYATKPPIIVGKEP